jgi:3-hydroxybutyryl-CoA dehydrogenase
VTGTVAVVGAGTMGAGIAQVAAVAGHPVLLYDALPGAAQSAVDRIRARLVALAAKGRLGVDPQSVSLTAVSALAELAAADLVVEAVVEELKAKRVLFAELEQAVAQHCILATNTSSLSPTAIATGLAHPERLVGLHFFNPVPLMRLAEVVPGLATSEYVVSAATRYAQAWGKTAVRASPTPGFIVNRVARPFYAEAWRLYEEHAASAATIDAVFTGAGGFRMGPFALMDLIGHDVNEAVTRSVWTAFWHDPRFTPSLAQRALVDSSRLGRKSGRGVYDYSGGEQAAAAPAEQRKPPAEVVEHGAPDLRALLARSNVPVLQGDGAPSYVELPSGALLTRCTGITASELSVEIGAPILVVDRCLDDTTAGVVALAASEACPDRAIDEAVGLLQAAGLDVHLIDDAAGLVLTRTVAMLVNLAADAVHRGVATAADIDAAMRLGANYPIGPIEWGERWGLPTVVAILDALQRTEGDPRYRPSPLLRRRAWSGGSIS